MECSQHLSGSNLAMWKIFASEWVLNNRKSNEGQEQKVTDIHKKKLTRKDLQLAKISSGIMVMIWILNNTWSGL